MRYRSALRIEKVNPYPPAIPAKSYKSEELWDRYFWVRYNMLGNANLLQLREQGIRSSGLPEFDKYIEKDELISQWNIDAMFEAWKKGFGPKVINYSDTEIIYEIIQQHLIHWVEYLRRAVNVGEAPFRDLVELDMFASAVYDKAKNVFSDEERQTAIATNFLSLTGRTLMSVTNKGWGKHRHLIHEVGANPSPQEEKVIPAAERTRESLTNVFSEQAAAIQAWRSK